MTVFYFLKWMLDASHLVRVVKEHNISEVFLLAVLLSVASESKIKSAWDLNMNGLFNVLELARKGQIKKVFWPSSIAAFGPTTPKEDSPQHAILSLRLCMVLATAGEDGVIIITKNLILM